MEKVKILYVDMEYHNLVAFNASFREIEHFELYTCRSASEALTHVYRQSIDILIIDQVTPDHIGTEFLPHTAHQTLKIVATAYCNNQLLEKAKLEGIIFEYINKPWYGSQLLQILENATSHCINRKKRVQEKNVNPATRTCIV